ncbi:LAFE_0G16226g1_1 [Lachancea fermentati]|uniref:DNA polymerase alpha subunit B n=1 Tax=Lachancea fermentati TaxID=4955 RepID=A0A1G4MIH0_LACFM|nr:LAFE_0G16226g1_1 [Lachancea fermentati]
MTLKNELIVRFGREAEDAEVLAMLEDIMKIYSIGVEDLFIKWEQFAYHQEEKSIELNSAKITEFKEFLLQQIEKKANAIGGTATSNPPSIKKPRINKPHATSPSLFGFGVPKTPTIKRRKVEGTPLSQNESVSLKVIHNSPSLLESPSEITNMHSSKLFQSSIDRTQDSISTPNESKKNLEPGITVETFNPDNVDVSKGLNFENEEKVQVIPFFEREKYRFRTMRQNLLDAAEVLDEQIELFTQIILDHYKLTPNDIGDPTIQSQSEIIAIGRIVPDSPTANGPLNIESLALETSRNVGIGRRIRLNLEKITEVTLFPGQIAVFRGKNANGEYFMVEETLQIPYLNSPVSTGEEIVKYGNSLDNDSMKIVITKGPYTANNTLDFSNLREFVQRLNNEIKPHAVIMFGPFLDITHPLIESGLIPSFPSLKAQPKTLDDLFLKLITPILREINPKIQTLLIPSTRDTISKHAAYPQDALDRKYLQLPKNFKCFTNPSTFQINEVFFGCSNVDSFKDIREIVKGGNTSSKNRISRIAEHILQQRRYYPLFPGAVKDRKIQNGKGKDIREHVSGADLEVPFLGLTEFTGDFIPDIIVIPSELIQFAKVVQNVVFVNPGAFIKPMGVRGTFAQLSVKAPSLIGGELTKVEGEEEVFLHNIWKRCRIDIVTS